MKMYRALLEFHGTTAWQIAEALQRRVEGTFRGWLPLWQVLVTETIKDGLTNFPSEWHFIPIFATLSRLWQYRERLDLPNWMKILPPSVWKVDLRYGAAKRPAAAAIAFALRQRDLIAWRQQAWEKLTNITSLWQELKAKQVLADLTEDPFIVVVGAAGGATGHAGILNAIDFWSEHPDAPLILVFLVGPHAGSSFDDFRTERANAYRLFLSVQKRQKFVEQLWAFWLDSRPNQRKQILQRTADFLFCLLARPEGAQLRRLFLDGFAAARRDFGAAVCRTDIFHIEAPLDALRRREALSALSSALRTLMGR
jgi:hypothetical protein